MKCVRLSAVLFVLLGACQVQAAGRAALVEKAQHFFDATSRGKFLFGFLHLGGAYKDHTCTEVVDVADSDGNTLPGQFCLRYQFDWTLGDSDNTTTVDLLFDKLGRLYDVNNEDSTSIVSPPYVFANGAIKVLGAAILEAFKNDLKDDDKKVIQDCIDNADAHGLMLNALKFQYNVIGR